MPSVARFAVERLALLRLLGDAGAATVVPLGVVDAVAVALPLANAAVTVQLVGRLGRLLASGPVSGSSANLVPSLVAITALLVAGQLVEAFHPLLANNAARRIDGRVRDSIRRLALAPEG